VAKRATPDFEKVNGVPLCDYLERALHEVKLNTRSLVDLRLMHYRIGDETRNAHDSIA
jgi:hypothetical protein